MAKDVLEGTNYRAIALLGRGGAGEVYEARHRHLNKRVAVKLLNERFAGDGHVMKRLELEGLALAKVAHESVVEVTDCGRTPGGLPFLVMPLLIGKTLDRELRERGELTLREGRRVIIAVLEGLSAIHAAGLVHRDVKPANVFLCDGKPPVVKLLDLGVAKVIDRESELVRVNDHTRAGITVGTPRYLPPEQALGRELDVRADIYAAGLLLYRMIAGRGPFDHCTGVGDVMVAHVIEEPRAPSAYARQAIPGELDALVLRALAKEPSKRFESAPAFAAALRDLVLEGPSAQLGPDQANPGHRKRSKLGIS
jgi:serine/threonine-protein kinase